MNQRAGRDTVLVSAGALAAELAQDPPPALLDVRWRAWAGTGLPVSTAVPRSIAVRRGMSGAS